MEGWPRLGCTAPSAPREGGTATQVASDGDVTVIDSRCGEDFAVFQCREGADAMVPQFDACASWWTQVHTWHCRGHAPA